MLLAGCLLAIAALGVYANSFFGPFIFDDPQSIPDNPTIRGLATSLSPPGGGLTVSGRPVLNFSFALNHAISGDRVWSYHLGNLLIHILAGLVLFGIVRRTLSIPGRSALNPPNQAPAAFADASRESAATLIGFAAALLWLVHPLQTEAVTYVVQRAESLMGLLYLLTLYCFIRGASGTREADGGGSKAQGERHSPLLPATRSSGGTSRVWFGLAVLACLLGMGTKEVMVSAPVMVFLYDRTFIAGGFRQAWRRRRWVHLALAATWILLAGLVVGSGTRGGLAGFGIGIGFWQYAATQFQAVAHYLWLAVWPHPLILDYGAEWVRGGRELVPYVPVVALLIIGTALALWRRPALGFLGTWFLAILAPTSLVPIATQTLAEHRMYLALAPLTVLFALGLHFRLGRRSWAVFLAVAIGLGWLTAQRNRTYRSALAIWSDTAAHRPACPGAHVNLGIALVARDQIVEALTHFQTAIRLDPANATGWYDAGSALLRLKRFPEAIVCYRQALRLHLDYPEVHTDLGEALLRAGRAAEAVEQYGAALRMMPGSADAEYRLGNALAEAGRPADARRHLEAALRLRPDYAEAHLNLGNLLVQDGRPAEAISQYEAALRIDPHNAAARDNLGRVLLHRGQLREAQAQFEQVLRLDPQSVAAAYDLGTALLLLGQTDEAKVQFQRVLALDPDHSAAHNDLGNILARAGQTTAAVAQYRAALRGDPDNAIAHYNLGAALLLLGRPAEARTELETALRLRPDLDQARARLRQLNDDR